MRIKRLYRYSYFHKEQKRSHKNNPFLVDNLYYNQEEDYFVCPMGQHMTLAGTSTRTSESGYRSQIHIYQAKRCAGCSMHGQCHKAQGDRQIDISHKLRAYKKKAREMLTCEEGLFHRSRRSIEPEAVFGQIKANKHYKRFRHIGKGLITMDFAIFAVAFNIGKIFNSDQKAKKTANTGSKNQLVWLWGGIVVVIKIPLILKIRRSPSQYMVQAA